jgi:hypothetical protein
MKKVNLEISDIDALSRLSHDAVVLIMSIFPPKNSEISSKIREESEFPIRWDFDYKNQLFEWVVSAMGSITLRLGAIDGTKKSQPPVFYLSIGKYEGDRYLWEDLDGNPINNLERQLEKIVLEKINLYFLSSLN